MIRDKFDEGWWRVLESFLMSEHFGKIGRQLVEETKEGKRITPILDNTFRAFKECRYRDLKVVILGLDPYPGEGVADGLAFSARSKPLDPPKSLQYIIDAVEKDVYGGFAVGFNEEYMNTDLTRWAKQGVLLLNTALSTHVGQTGVHLELWNPFIRTLFYVLSQANSGVIYILLGAKAKQWQAAINKAGNHILTATHPASCAYKGLKEWDCEGVFSQANKILEANNGPESKILW